jgi:hypothetical protein
VTECVKGYWMSALIRLVIERATGDQRNFGANQWDFFEDWDQMEIGGPLRYCAANNVT